MSQTCLLYTSIGGLMKNIIYAENNQVQQLMRSAFLSVMEEQATLPLNKLLHMGVYLLCWLSRYQYRLFKGLKLPETALLLYMGACGAVSYTHLQLYQKRAEEIRD